MKKQTSTASIMGRLALAAFLIMLSLATEGKLKTPFVIHSAYAASRILCVNAAGGTTTAPCINQSAYTTIQAGVNAASDGDEIRIAQGIYTSGGSSVVSISNKSVILLGGYQNGNWSTSVTSTTTVIDGQGARPAFDISAASVFIERLTVRSGKNSNGGGLAANISLFDTVYVVDSIFTNNVATGSGGGLFVVGGPTVIIRTRLIGNTAGEDGGGFYGLRLIMVDGDISSNTATRNAGGAHAEDSAIERVRVSGNTATVGSGGGLSVAGILTDTQVLNNTAGDSGGGLDSSFSSSIKAVRCIFQGNRAAHRPGDNFERVYAGGGLYVEGNVTLDRTLVISNTAQGSGGGVYQWGLDGRANSTDVTFDRNVALQGSGGGLVVDGSATIAGTAFRNNRAAVDGGGLAQTSPSNGRPPSFVNVTSSAFENNRAATGNGGGIFVDDQANLNATYMANNVAGMDGGGAYQTDAFIRALFGEFSITNSRFEHNRATNGSGGGLYISHNSSMVDTQINSNTAGSNGGGAFIVFVEQARLTHTLLGDNRAATSGDSIFIDSPFSNGQVSLLHVTIASAALAPHAAIQVQAPDATLTLTNTAVTSHTIGIARLSDSKLIGDYNAFFGNGTNQKISGASTPLTFSHFITSAPHFDAPQDHDFHLRAGSPLINAGDPSRNYSGQLDIDNQKVPGGGRADIGADEFYLLDKKIYLPLLWR